MTDIIDTHKLLRYDIERNCFVMRDLTPKKVLNPWEELAQVKRPSIFLQDPRFRATKTGPQVLTTIANPKPFFPYTDNLKDK